MATMLCNVLLLNAQKRAFQVSVYAGFAQMQRERRRVTLPNKTTRPKNF